MTANCQWPPVTKALEVDMVMMGTLKTVKLYTLNKRVKFTVYKLHLNKVTNYKRRLFTR